MKTISELQQELRSIRKDLAKMDQRLSDMDAELMSFKETAQANTSYDHIYNLAEAMPMIQHPIAALSQKRKSVYLGILLMMTTLEDSISDQQLLFLQRMIMADESRKRIDFYMGNLGKIQPDNVIFCLNDEVIAAHANHLLLDMIVITKLGKNCSVNAFNVVADVASILKIDQKQFKEICNVTRAVLTQDHSCIPNHIDSIIQTDKLYGFYLKELPGWEERIAEAKKVKISQIQEKIRFFR